MILIRSFITPHYELIYRAIAVSSQPILAAHGALDHRRAKATRKSVLTTPHCFVYGPHLHNLCAIWACLSIFVKPFFDPDLEHECNFFSWKAIFCLTVITILLYSKTNRHSNVW